MQKIKKFIGVLFVAIACILGLILFLWRPSYRYLGYTVWGIAGVTVCYLLINLIKHKNRMLYKILRIILTVSVIFGGIAAAITGILIGMRPLANPNKSIKYIIVLGATISGNSPSPALQDRLNAAYCYLTAHPDTICIVSGGLGNEDKISEAQCMFNELTAMGIAPSRIWMEDQSRNTRENFRFSLDLIEKRTNTRPTTAGVISSEYHLYRAGMVAGWNHLTPILIPAKTSSFMGFLNSFVREIPAVWYYAILGGFQ